MYICRLIFTEWKMKRSRTMLTYEDKSITLLSDMKTFSSLQTVIR